MRNSKGKVYYGRGDYPRIGRLDKAILPADAVFGGRHRVEDTYSDYNYHLHLYQARYSPKKIYERLDFAEAGETKYEDDNPTYTSFGTDKHKVKNGPEIEPFESFFSPYYTVVRLWRKLIAYSANEIFLEYFYSASLLYICLWTYFYIVEYVVICLQLYFPVLNWILYNPIFIWPIANDFYFSHFLFLFYFPALVIFFMSQYANKVGAAGFSDEGGASHFFVITLGVYFFSTIFCFYVLGFSVLFVILTLYALLSVSFLFFLYRPHLYTKPSYGDSSNPIKFLPLPPAQKQQLFLPRYQYRYPYFRLAEDGATRLIGTRKAFTRFPFTLNRLRGLSEFYARIHIVRKANFLDLRIPAALSSYPSTTYPKFPNAYGFDPEAFFFYLYIPKLATYENLVEDEEQYFTRYIDPPVGISTNQYAGLMAQRARGYVDSLFDFIPNSDHQYSNQLIYLRNWLGYVSSHRTKVSTFQRFTLLRSSYFADKSPGKKFNKFPKLAAFLSCYDYIPMVLDFVTCYKYYSYPADLAGNDRLVNQLRSFNYILTHALVVHPRLLDTYTNFLYHFYNSFDWDLLNNTPALFHVYGEVCDLFDINYKLISRTAKKRDQDFTFINFALFYQMAGGLYD